MADPVVVGTTRLNPSTRWSTSFAITSGDLPADTRATDRLFLFFLQESDVRAVASWSLSSDWSSAGSATGLFGSLRTSCYTALGTSAIAQTVVPKDSAGNVLGTAGASGWHAVLVAVRNARSSLTSLETASQLSSFTTTYSRPNFWLSVANYSGVGIFVAATTNATEATNYPVLGVPSNIFGPPINRCGVSIGLVDSTSMASSFTYAWTGPTSGSVPRALALGIRMDGDPDPIGTGWSVGRIKY